MNIFGKRRGSVTPSKIVYKDVNDFNGLFFEWVIFLYHRFRALLAAGIIGAIATALGMFTYRIFTLPSFTFEQVMNTIFRSHIPNASVIFPTIITSSVFAVIFMGGSILGKKGVDAESHGFTKFMGGIVTIVFLDLLLFKINSYQIYLMKIDLSHHIEVFAAQGGSIFLVLCCLPIYNMIINRALMPPSKLWTPPEKFIVPLRLLWFYFVSIAIIFTVSFISTNGIPLVQNMPAYNIFDWRLTGTRVGAILVGVGIGALFYWPSKHSSQGPRFSLGRFLLFVGSLLLVGLIYRNIPNQAQIYIAVVVVTVGLSILSIPLHRSII